MKIKSPNYSGVLLEPIIDPENILRYSLITGEQIKPGMDYQKVLSEYIVEQKVAKISALFEHYSIPESDNYVTACLDLIYHLASDHIPGFQVVPASKKSPGRPSIWKGLLGAELFVSVKRTMLLNDISAEKACEIIFKQNKFPVRSAKIMTTRFFEAQKENKLLQVIAALAEQQGKSMDQAILDEKLDLLKFLKS